MGLRPTQGDENRFEQMLRSPRRGTVKAVLALGQLRPFLSVTWNARFELMSVTPLLLAGRAVST